MTKPKKLIEVAMPVKEVSAESVRDKSIRHGHISTLHLWWARRPLPVCRAVVFASLVPDPLDPHCPEVFREAVQKLIGKGDAYKPYQDIPHTVVVDEMEDNLRNRLLMFIGKFSEKYVRNEKQGMKTPARDLLSSYSLIKWDNKNNEEILTKARKMLFVAHNAQTGASLDALLPDFDRLTSGIRDAEKALYKIPDRHLPSASVTAAEQTLHNAIEAFLDRMPTVFDPFAGGGAIPLEAARLGCRTYGNDLNPVAHIIQRGSVEFPQKYGKPATYTAAAFRERYGAEALQRELQTTDIDDDTLVHIDNRLSYDVEHYARLLLALVEDEVGQYYPRDSKGNKPIAYYWARVGRCSNPTCGAEVPLLRQFYLVNKKDKKVHLLPIINGTSIDFEIRKGKYSKGGWMNRANLTCPCCGNLTDDDTLKKQFRDKTTGIRALAVISEGQGGKRYEPMTNSVVSVPSVTNPPRSKMQVGNNRNFNTPGWGFDDFGDMFTPRQLLTLQNFVEKLQDIKDAIRGDKAGYDDYDRAVITYLGIWIDRIAIANTSFGVWHTSGEKLERPMGRQAIPMVFDFPESNPFCESTGSAVNQLDWITRYIFSESEHPFAAVCNNAASGEKTQFKENTITATITDPPYYDAIAYADLSDFFYIWQKRTLSDVYPLNFATPQTPKTEECTALKHHHDNDVDRAYQHFEDKLLQIFDAIEHQTSDIVSIMFAHQSTRAWSTLCNSILNARMNITGSWANDTEQTSALKTNKAFLASSVTVSCVPSKKSGIGDYTEIRRQILDVILEEVRLLYGLGFRGADLLTACFGKAVSVFGSYERVEKADGSGITVAELLEMARDAAFNAIVSDFPADEVTRFYIGWLHLFGFTKTPHDDVMRISQIGLHIDISALHKGCVLIQDGQQESLAHLEERLECNPRLGMKAEVPLIDTAHGMMHLYRENDRAFLLKFIRDRAPSADDPAWRVLNALAELLPKSKEINDYDYATGLLVNQENLIRDAQGIGAPGEQAELGL